MKKLKYLLCLCVMIIMILVPSTFAACDHNYDTTERYTVKVKKSNHCSTVLVRSKCSKCNALKLVKSTKQISHKWNDGTLSGGCTTPLVTKTSCKVCGFEKTLTVSSAKGHNYSKKVKTIKKPSCSMVGKAKYKCSRCSATTEKEFGKVLGHSYSEFVSTSKQATCVNPGKAIYKCHRTGCNKTAEKNTPINKSNHTKYGFEITDTTHQVKCEGCNTLIGSKVNHTYDVNGNCACGHSISTVVNCKHLNTIWETTDSNHKLICVDCDYIVLKETNHIYDINSKCICGHSIAIENCNHTNSTWEVYAKEHQKRCSDCKEVIIKATEHTFGDNGKCICGKPKEDKCMHYNSNPATCTEKSVCRACGAIVRGPLGHNYIWEDGSTEWKIAEEYHYRYCETCAAPETLIKENHNFENGECRNCGYEVGDVIEEDFREPEEIEYVSGDPNACTHPNMTYAVTKEAKCDEPGEQVASCARCTYEVKTIIEPTHNFDKSAKYYLQTVSNHWVRCIWCGAKDEDTGGLKHVWNKANGTCLECSRVCTHDWEYGCVCVICGFKQASFCEDGEHDLEYKSDNAGHVYYCLKCGFEDGDGLNIHNYERNENNKAVLIDLCNGYHAATCLTCGYKHKTIHIYDKDGMCRCGSSNVTGIQDVLTETLEFTLDEETEVEIQTKLLRDLDYDIGAYGVDGDIGGATIEAINKLLSDQGSSRRITSKDEITPEIYTLIMNCQETSGKATIRQLRPLLLDGTITNEQTIMLAQAKLLDTEFYDGKIDGKDSKEFQVALAYYCKVNEVENTNLSTDFVNGILSNDETKTQAVTRVRKERKDEISVAVEEMGLVYFAESTYGQLYVNPNYFEYGRDTNPEIPDWGEPLIEDTVDCSFMTTYMVHEIACYYGDTALEEWSTVPRDTHLWKQLGQLIETKEKIENGEITDEKIISDFYSHYDEEARTYTTYVDYVGDEVAFPIDSFSILWSVNDGTPIIDHKFPACAIVVERQKEDSGHVEVVREDGSTAVYTAGGKNQWTNEGKIAGTDELYSYDRRTDHSYVLEYKIK